MRLQQGVSMIEVLVTAVVFSVGLLGVASLQIYGLKMNTNADIRTRATLLAGDIVERIRANPGQWDQYNFGFDDCAQAATRGPGESVSIVATDTRQWCRRMGRELPQASAAVVVDQGVTTVTIRWLEREGRAVGEDAQGNASELGNHQLVFRARLSNV
ncbi:MAG: type IV pilus modification protein PilV [Marinobacter sp.]|uniref:type IV pilus modification protein PilV n=1 Tax=Marinobacter sp. TaxID=50741 RepID=UPI00299E7495|nr:type IV pilus modification protein PilV [Marinobacter sp.]MDX1634642.1 type IV pilus modification protein PilV [Marinobacter sp.]